LGSGAGCLRNSTLGKNALSPCTPSKKNKKKKPITTPPPLSLSFLNILLSCGMLLQRTLVFGTDSFGGGNYSVANSFRNWRNNTCVLLWTNKNLCKKRDCNREISTPTLTKTTAL
jgi:hypothetical protein